MHIQFSSGPVVDRTGRIYTKITGSSCCRSSLNHVGVGLVAISVHVHLAKLVTIVVMDIAKSGCSSSCRLTKGLTSSTCVCGCVVICIGTTVVT